MRSPPMSRWIRHAACLAAALALTCAAIPALADTPSPVRRYALLVGANDGGPYRTSLRYAHDDARQVAGVLTDLGNVAPADRHMLFDPSAEELSAAIDTLQETLSQAGDARTEVVFYYSGHSDETGLLLGEERFLYSELRKQLEGLDAELRVGILDSCASGALIRGKGGRPVAPFLADTSREVSGTAFISSSSADEAAQEADRIGGSYFTHFLVSGLRGAADATGDGKVTLNEAYQFAFDETLARTSETQHGPQHANYDFQLAGTGDLVLTDLTRTAAELVLTETVDASVLVRDPAGRVVIELVKRPDQPIRLGLAPGRYNLTFSREGRFATVMVHLVEGQPFTIAGEDIQWTEGEVAVARGGEEHDFTWHPAPVRVQVWPTANAGHVADHLVFNLPAGRSGRLDGAAIGFGLNLVDRDVKGAMVTLGANVVGGDMEGVQIALGYNHVVGDGGFQLAVGANTTEGTTHGMQFAVGGNIAGHAVYGAQWSVGFNYAGEPVRGAQLSVGANLSRRAVYGVQGALINYSTGLRGAQLGLVNIGGNVTGTQIGLVNIGGHVKGAQIGLVNVADRVDGVPFGLVSVSAHGRFDPMVYATESTPINLDIKLGNRWFYTLFGGGVMPNRHAIVSFGIGTQFVNRPVFVDFDLTAQTATPWADPFQQTEGTWMGRARVTLGIPLAKQFAFVVGAHVTGRWWSGTEPVPVAPGWIDPDNRAVFWPGFHGGVQF